MSEVGEDGRGATESGCPHSLVVRPPGKPSLCHRSSARRARKVVTFFPKSKVTASNCCQVSLKLSRSMEEEAETGTNPAPLVSNLLKVWARKSLSTACKAGDRPQQVGRYRAEIRSLLLFVNA